jgi:hypothetical protein
METLTIAIIVITLTVILFSSFSYSYVSPDSNAQVPIDLLNSTGKPRSSAVLQQADSAINKEEIGKVNPKASTYALFNLPEKDEYMTTDLRNQIDALRTQYYYDNCQFIEKNSDVPSTKAKFTDICAQPTIAQITFTDYNFNIA